MKIIDLTGTEFHRRLRSAAAELTADPVKRDQRRRAHDQQWRRCAHGNNPADCCGTPR